MDNWDRVAAALIGGFFALLVFSLGLHFQRKRSQSEVAKLRGSLLESLRSELEGNQKVIEESVKVNKEAVILAHAEDEKRPAEKRKGLDTEINDETRLFVMPLLDTPLSMWVSQEVRKLFPGFPVAALIDYKLSLNRANFLIQRNMPFKYRVHFLLALQTSLESLAREKRKFEERLKEVGLL